MPVSEVERQATVKVPEKLAKSLGDDGKPQESDLSHIDCLMPPVMISFWFFYDYQVDNQKLETALKTTLSRYQELAGRLESKKIILNNEGAKIVVLKGSSLTLSEIEKENYDFDLLIDHFGAEKPFEDGFLMTLFSQNLSCGGIVLIFSFQHLLCDVNSAYQFVAEFSSQVKNGCFKIAANEVITEKRLLTLAPSNSAPIFDHSEFEIISEEEKLAYFESYFLESARPKKIVKLKLSQDDRQKLKAFVCGDGGTVVTASANDCFVALIWSVCIATTQTESEDELASTLFLQCNGRFRIKPALLGSFFGNVILSLPIKSNHCELSVEKLLNTAEKIRSKLLSVNNEYIQSTLDYLATNEESQIAFPKKYDFIVSNWDRPLDWYGDADLGQGKPRKFTTVTKALDRCCLVLPSRDGGLEAILGLEAEHMGRFEAHPLIKQFFHV